MKSCLLLLVTLAVSTIAYPRSLAARSGKVVQEHNRILCPVIAAMVDGGDLHPDEYGDITMEDLYTGLHEKVGANTGNAYFQASGIAAFDADNKLTEAHRRRCVPGSACWIRKETIGPNAGTERYLNVYMMNGHQATEHGFSTGVRGGATNVPEFDRTGGRCNGTYPCEDRFQEFYMPCVNKEGNFDRASIDCILCKAWAQGDRTGEFAYNPTQRGMQWQEVTAMNGWLTAFGRLDKDELYMTEADVRRMIIDGKYPEGWQKREWASIKDFVDAALTILSCADKDGYNPAWWEGTSCESHTGETCTKGKCGGGATCINTRCVCGLGSNGVAMCAKNGKCEERENTCTYFGEPCVMLPADSPVAPW